MKQNNVKNIRGASGGGGGGGTQHVPVEAADSLRSSAFAQVLDLVSEGEIEGLVNGLQSVYLDGTAIQNPDGTFNFTGCAVDPRYGTPTQDYLASQSDAENEIAVGVLVVAATPVVRTVTNPNVDRVRVTIAMPQLTASNPSTGDLGGTSVNYKISVQCNGGGYVDQINDTVNGKSTSKYQRSYSIPLRSLGSPPYDIKVTRVTADAADVNTQNIVQFTSYTEIEDVKLRYPNSAVMSVRAYAQQFSNIPTRAYDLKLMKIRIPTNATVRADGSLTYSGSWDGTFQTLWSSNPAWVFYDLLTNNRYGLGNYIPEAQVDKWTLYSVGRYCDELIANGFGQTEPRFSCNLYLQSRNEAFKVINDLASIFRSMVYWAGGSLTVSQDAPSDPVYLYSPANVVGGLFTYQGASVKARHTVALVGWNDPADFYRQKIEYVEDTEAILRYGVIETQVTAMGCTSRGQAHRLGRWLLLTERYQSETVNFQTGLDAASLRPGEVIKVADPVRSGKRAGGRISSSNSNSIVADYDLPFDQNEHMTLSVILPDGSLESIGVDHIAGREIFTSGAMTSAPQPGAMWMLETDAVSAQLFRILSIGESKPGIYDITALAHNESKYATIDTGATLIAPQITSLSATPDSPTDLKVTETLYAVGNSVRVKVTCSWALVPGAGAYAVQYKRDDQNLISLPQTNANDVEILSAEPGIYTFYVSSISPVGKRSASSTITTKVLGKGAPPAQVQNFSLMPQANMAYLTWDLAVDLDVLIGGSVRIRFTPDTDTPLWRNAVDVATGLSGTATKAQVPLLAGTYMAKFVDAGGVPSVNESIIITSVPTALAINEIVTITEDPDFSGTKTDMEVYDALGGLVLSANILVDDLVDIDSIPAWDFAGGVASFGTYLFHEGEDLGAVYTSRVTAAIKALTVDVADTIDWRTDDIDDWVDVDGALIDDVNAILYMRTTEDDPGGTPTWTDWKPFFVGDYRARAFQFKLEATSGSPYHTIVVLNLAVTIDMPDRVLSMPGLTTLAAQYTVNFESPFKDVPSIGITTHNMNSGDYYRIASKTNSSFKITFFDSSNTAVARTFDAVVKGYGRAA